MKIKKKNVLFVLMIIWQLYFWFEFVPTGNVDPFSDLAPIFYLVLVIPVGVWGIRLSFLSLKKDSEMTRQDKIIAWILLIVSICTAIPPLFLIVRWAFYPLALLLD